MTARTILGAARVRATAGHRLAALGAALTIVGCVASPASGQQAQLRAWTLGGTINVNGHALPLPRGTVDGTLDFGTGRFTSQMGLVPVTTKVTVPGLIGASADLTLSLEEAAPLAGQVGTSGPNAILDATPAFLLHVQRARSTLVPLLNLDSSTCRSKVPFSLPLHYTGPLDFASGFSFSGSVSLADFEGCGLSAARVNQLLSGPGSYTVTLRPGPNSPNPLPGVVPPPAGSGVSPSTSPSPSPNAGTGLDTDLGADFATDPGPEAGLPAGFPDLAAILGLLTDAGPPTLEVTVSRSQRVLKLGGAAASVTCDKRCLLTATGTLKVGGRSYKLLSASAVAGAGASKKLTVRLTDRARKQLRSALKRNRGATVQLGLRGTDAAGNRSKLEPATVKVSR
jgi:hypothetical protein